MISGQSTLITSILLVISSLLLSSSNLSAQESLTEKRKNKYILLPATAYSPETGFTIGVIGGVFFDLAKGDTLVRMSNINFATIFTTKKQSYQYMDWFIATPNEQHLLIGKIDYKSDIDRHYGLGNDALALVRATTEEGVQETTNFLDISLNRAEINFTAYRRIYQQLYGGFVYNFEKAWNTTPFENRTVLSPNEIGEVPVDGTISGLGLGLVYDSRKNSSNPLKGTFIQLQSVLHRNFLGSEYHYDLWRLDARKYWNTFKDQVLGVRIFMDHRNIDGDYIPLYRYPTIGGKDFMRGYYQGTYRDRQMMGFEVEYRLPFPQDKACKAWEVWKRLGMTVFASTAKVYPSISAFNFQDFRWAVGVGGRYVLSFPQRVNLRLDVAWGLDPLSSVDGRQFSVYFFVAEAF